MPTEGIPILFSPLQAVLILFIVFIVPIALLLPIGEVGTLPAMLLESLGLGFLWNRSIDDEDANYDKRRTKRKKIIRSRAEQISLNSEVSTRSTKYYPGLVNISGTYCFLNATLQAIASLCYLQPYLDNMYAKAELFDVSTPVLDALVAQLQSLNTPSSKPTSFRPTDLIHALSTPTPGFKRGALFASREHQDAQELFQLLTEKLKEEALAIDKEAYRDRGLSGLEQHNQVYLQRSAREPGKGVFEGLTANRRSCTVCGYTEAVMHFTFDNLQLSVPRKSQCTIEECLEDYTRMELLGDCICRKCSMMATLRKLEADVIKVSTPAADGAETSSRKKRTKDVRKLAARVKAALDSGRIEEDIKGVIVEKIISKSSTKQSMFARTPPVLALHLNRSSFFGHYATKNNCGVFYPEILDLTPFTTSGALSTAPNSPISKPASAIPPRSSTPTPSVYSSPRTLYRLTSVVCHYGQHSFGHYVAYRRKPRDPSLRNSRWDPPKLQCPYGCECERCEASGPARESGLFSGSAPSYKGKERMVEDGGWLRISDETAREVGLDAVLSETSGAFMLFYEKITPFQSESLRTSPRSSQETVTPHHEERKVKLEDPTDNGLLHVFNARIVRSVSVGKRSREGSMINGNAPDVKSPNGDLIPNGHSHPPSGFSEPPKSPKSSKAPNGTSHAQELGSIPNGNSSPPFSTPTGQSHHSPQSPEPPGRTVDLVA
ncbi:hypothetical protein FRC14_001362 [Serendipita sp. 396]|nr:hypothetical protein FRC14_001362 [Serendipita sp. 396]